MTNPRAYNTRRMIQRTAEERKRRREEKAKVVRQNIEEGRRRGPYVESMDVRVFRNPLYIRAKREIGNAIRREEGITIKEIRLTYRLIHTHRKVCEIAHLEDSSVYFLNSMQFRVAERLNYTMNNTFGLLLHYSSKMTRIAENIERLATKIKYPYEHIGEDEREIIEFNKRFEATVKKLYRKVYDLFKKKEIATLFYRKGRTSPISGRIAGEMIEIRTELDELARSVQALLKLEKTLEDAPKSLLKRLFG